MNITVSGKNLDVTDGIREHVERKVGKIGRYFENSLRAQVTLNVEKGRHIVELTVPLGSDGMMLRAESESGDMYASVDQVVDRLERQIRKYKTRVNRRARRLDGRLPFIDGPEAEPDDDEPRVVKTKRFSIKPMDVEEAVLQMNLLGHDFFVFRNDEDQELSVLYRRRDGNYGLIDPQD
ncbi:MAG: ribosome-associated translation inhibitor RaiA [Thermaerobacterales bacterium]